jgi:hypothetical protein
LGFNFFENVRVSSAMKFVLDRRECWISMLRYQFVGQPRGFRQTVSRTTGKDGADGLRERNAVTNADKKGADPCPGSQNRSDALVPVEERRFRSRDRWRGIETSDEERFGAADGGSIQPEADVACQAEAARVRDSLGVE